MGEGYPPPSGGGRRGLEGLGVGYSPPPWRRGVPLPLWGGDRGEAVGLRLEG